eukprot:4207157-Pyramimonas_sp.AAC.1
MAGAERKSHKLFKTQTRPLGLAQNAKRTDRSVRVRTLACIRNYRGIGQVQVFPWVRNHGLDTGTRDLRTGT